MNYVPSAYKGEKIYRGLGLKSGTNLKSALRRIPIKMRFNKHIIRKFNRFRDMNLKMSSKVDEENIATVLRDYETIIVGSDQVWAPGCRSSKVYFLGFDELFQGSKISYAADSTISEIDPKHMDKLKKELDDFKAISVRNKHSQEFVEQLTGKAVPIVVDPTVLCDFSKLDLGSKGRTSNERYILVYVLGKDIKGANKRAIEKIREAYGDMHVYAVVDPTMSFNVNVRDYADKVFYDLGPVEWIDMLRNATFVYTDSFHGTLFSLKFRKPFLAYYAEDMRATRFIDLGDRYKIDRFIVNSVDEIDTKKSLKQPPDFTDIDCVMEDHEKTSIEFLHAALNMI